MMSLAANAIRRCGNCNFHCGITRVIQVEYRLCLPYNTVTIRTTLQQLHGSASSQMCKCMRAGSNKRLRFIARQLVHDSLGNSFLAYCNTLTHTVIEKIHGLHWINSTASRNVLLDDCMQQTWNLHNVHRIVEYSVSEACVSVD